ncbi:Dual specificity protein phosphatase 10 [Haplosporangium gracile]|nr:Dual specificity protein phosphatase 10 [Haplosporangium gracile]
MVRPTSHSFSLQRPLLAQDMKKTRNSKRLSLLVPPSPGKLESLVAMASASSPSFPPTSSLSSRRPFTPAPLSSALSHSHSHPSSTITIGTPTATPAIAVTTSTSSTTDSRRHSQLLLNQALPTPRLPLSTNPSSTHRPISAYFADFSAEYGAASPYTSEPVCVLPHLYLGAEHNATDVKMLSRLGITAVLNVAVEITQQEQQQRQQQTQQQLLQPPTSRKPINGGGGDRVVLDPHSGSSIHYKSLSWTHHQRNLRSEFPLAFDYIEEAKTRGGKVLVHCQLGVSRSASLVIAYVMKTLHMGLTDAYELVKARSAVISPNMSLMYQLSEFEKSLNTSNSNMKKIPMYMDEDEEEYPYPTENMDLDTPASSPIAATTPAPVAPVKVLPPVTTRPRSSIYLSSTPIPQTPMNDRFSFSNSSVITPVTAAPSSVSTPTTMGPVPKTRLQLQSTNVPKHQYQQHQPSSSALPPIQQYPEGVSIHTHSREFKTPDMVYTPLSALSNPSPVPTTPTSLSPPMPAFATALSGIGSRRQHQQQLPPALSLSSSSSSVSSFATSSHSRPSSTSSTSSTSISQTIPDSPLQPTTPRSAGYKLTLAPTTPIMSSAPIAPVAVVGRSPTTPGFGIARKGSTSSLLMMMMPPSTPTTPSTPTGSTHTKTKKAAVIQSLASVLTRRWSNHLGSPSSSSASAQSQQQESGSNQIECLSSMSHQSNSSTTSGSDVMTTADGQLQARELGRMMIHGQGAASVGVSVPPTPTTATTPATTTTMANGGKEPEFIFSPRPCSPPLLETTTRTFGDLYQALRMEG